MANKGGSSALGDKAKGKIDDLMKELALGEDDLDDVIFEEDDAAPADDLRWMVLARVHMDKGFNTYWFFRNMRGMGSRVRGEFSPVGRKPLHPFSSHA